MVNKYNRFISIVILGSLITFDVKGRPQIKRKHWYTANTAFQNTKKVLTSTGIRLTLRIRILSCYSLIVKHGLSPVVGLGLWSKH